MLRRRSPATSPSLRTATDVPARRRQSGRRGVVAVLALAAAMVVSLSLAPTPAEAIEGEIQSHDPSVIKADGCYYSFSTYDVSISQHRTCDNTPATGWESLGTIWDSVPGWIVDKLGKVPTHLWAPELVRVDGEYRMYYAASIPGDGYYAVMGLATATDIEGPWIDRGMITDQDYPIDPNVITEPDGSMYLMYGSWYGVYLDELDPETGKLAEGGVPVELANGIEGSTVVKDGQYYYLFGSKGLCCSGTNSTYFTAVGRSASLEGPYLDQSGKDMFDGGGTVVMRGAWPKVGAGGADAFTDESGTYLAYHYYDGDNGGLPWLDIRKVGFIDGWPTLSDPLGSTDNHLLNNNSNLCVGPGEGGTTDSAAVSQNTCHSGDDQQWKVTKMRNGKGYRIASADGSTCLAIAGDSKDVGAAVVQEPCDSSTGQRWTRTPVVGGYVTFANAHSGLCLDVPRFSTEPGTHLTQYTCNGGTNQQWILV